MRLVQTCWHQLTLLSRFGNFIGEEVESEAASEAGVGAGDYVYDDDQADAQDEELMEVDGKNIPYVRGRI